MTSCSPAQEGVDHENLQPHSLKDLHSGAVELSPVNARIHLVPVLTQATLRTKLTPAVRP